MHTIALLAPCTYCHNTQYHTYLIVHFRHDNDHVHPLLRAIHAVCVERHGIGRQPTPIVARRCGEELAPTREVIGQIQITIEVCPHLLIAGYVDGRRDAVLGKTSGKRTATCAPSRLGGSSVELNALVRTPTSRRIRGEH